MAQKLQPPFNRVQLVQISADEAGQRIDNFLLRVCKGVPKSHIYRILRKGEVRVNKKRIKPSYKLQQSDELRMPPIRVSEKQSRRVPDSLIKRLEQRVIYDDDRILVLDKPAGLAVHAGSGIDFGVIDAVQQMHGNRELFLVHRLDRDTSGCLLIARDRDALRSLQFAMQQDRVSKHYLALVRGQWQLQKTGIEMFLRRNKIQGGERLVQVDDSGKASESIFDTQAIYREQPAGIGSSLMKIQLITGRTHQIRVHSAASGHPLAGDLRYGEASFNEKMKQLGLQRMFLHASGVRFPHPDNDQEIILEPPLDDDLQQVLDNMGQ